MPTQSGRVLDVKTLDYLRSRGREVQYEPDAVIVRRGEPGRALSIITDGEVEVRLPTAGGGTMTVCRLGPGDPVGEISLLRDAPTSADVVAISRVVAVEVSRELLQDVLAENEVLRRALMARLATNLHRTTMESWQEHERAETFAALTQRPDEVEQLIAVSASMKAVVKKIAELAATPQTVLISGEPGTGKTLVAQHIHNASDRQTGPFIVIDCLTLSEQAVGRLLAGFSAAVDEETQDGPSGAVTLARGGTLVLRHIEALGEVVEPLLAAQHRGKPSEGEHTPDVRLILVKDHDRPFLGAENETSSPRFSALEVLEVPPLRARRRDIIPLATHLLSCHDSKGDFELDGAAQRALVALQYRRANVRELRDVLDLAIRCAEGSTIRSEHIFGGLDERVPPEGIEIARSGLLQRIVAGSWLAPLKLATAAGFATAVLLCLLAPTTPAGAATNGFIWGFWEPVVFALFLLAGAVWCTVCPLSTAGRFAQRLHPPDRPPPQWLRRIGPYLAPTGFFLIIWSELVFGMTSNPRGSAMLLFSLVAASVVCCLVYSREVWCAFLCPLGRLASALAPAAPLSIAADREVCSSTCTTFDCYRGTDRVPGCTVFHHPQQVLDGHRCKLCFDCVRSCPHHAVKLRLRAPLKGAWKLGASASTLMPFGLTVFLLTPVLLASQLWFEPFPFTLVTVICLAVGFIGGPLLSRILCPWKRDDSFTPPRVAVAFLILGWGPLMAYQLGHVPMIGSLRILGSAGSVYSLAFPAGVSVLSTAQILFIALAGIFGIWVLNRSRRSARFVVTPAWALVYLLAGGYLLLSVFFAVVGSSTWV